MRVFTEDQDLGLDSCLETSKVLGSLGLSLKQARGTAAVEAMQAVFPRGTVDPLGESGQCEIFYWKQDQGGGGKQSSGECTAHISAYTALVLFEGRVPK